MPARILVIANETCPAATLREAVLGLAGDRPARVLVVAPALNGWLATWASDVATAEARAEERVRTAVAALRRAGLDAEAAVGDSDPIVAIEDALRWFPADAIVLSTHPLGRSRWLARDVARRARERFALPLTHVVVDLDRERVQVLHASAA